MSARSSFLPAAIGAAALAVAGAPAFAQNVSEVGVSGRAPTSITISLAGKTAAVVRQEVRTASDTVCSNAVSNRELEFYDKLWCQQKTASKAMRRYAAIVSARSQSAALPTTIVLSSR
jgi:hypothetical protein